MSVRVYVVTNVTSHRGKKKTAQKKNESRNLSHQYNGEFAQFTLSRLNRILGDTCLWQEGKSNM